MRNRYFAMSNIFIRASLERNVDNFRQTDPVRKVIIAGQKYIVLFGRRETTLIAVATTRIFAEIKLKPKS